LFELIGDSNDEVRFQVADFLSALNDPRALDRLMAQLEVEHDPRIVEKIAEELGILKDPRALPSLEKLLHDPEPDSVHTAAARALAGGLGADLRRSDPVQAVVVSADLRQILGNADSQPGTGDLRAACMAALAALGDKLSYDTFRDCFKPPGETAEVRRAALVGLGVLGDHRADALVADQLDDNDRTIRFEAARAMQTVATPAQEEKIIQQMKAEKDAEVADALWVAFQNLLKNDSPDAIQQRVAQFADPDKRLAILLALDTALQKVADHQQAIASNDQKIADAMMQTTPRDVAGAITRLHAALDYWRGPGKTSGESGETLETLIAQLLDDELSDDNLAPNKYDEATKFAASQLAFGKVYQPTVGPRLRDKIDQLLNRNDLADAQKLIDLTLNMSPPLESHYLQQVQQQETDLQNAKKKAGP
jgi:HEAT repeat protein